MIRFSDNHTVLELHDKETEFTSTCSQMIVTLDDITFHGNQSEYISYLPPGENGYDKVIFNTFLLGITVRINDNRLRETTASAMYSLFTMGFAAMALGNHCTHCLFILGVHKPRPLIQSALNYVLASRRCKTYAKKVRKKYKTSPALVFVLKTYATRIIRVVRQKFTKKKLTAANKQNQIIRYAKTT